MKHLAAILISLALAGPVLARENASKDDDGGMPECSMAAAKAGKRLPFGCANALNLEAMTANPAEVSDVQPASPPIGEPAVRAIGRHRDGNIVPLPTTNSTEAPGTSGAR